MDVLAGGPVPARRVPATLDLELFALAALVLVRALAGVPAWLGRLVAGAAVEAGLRQALVVVEVAKPPGPAEVAGARVVVDGVHAGPVDAPVERALVDVGGAQRVSKAVRTVTLEFLQKK